LGLLDVREVPGLLDRLEFRTGDQAAIAAGVFVAENAVGGAPHDENWFWRILHSRREEKVVYLDNPVSLTIAD